MKSSLSEPTFFMPQQASTVAPLVDDIYYGIYWLSVVLFVGIVAAMLYFVIKHRRKSRTEIPSGPSHGLVIEVAWTVIPTIIVMIIFVYGFKGYLKMAVAPGDAMEINVTAKKWLWTFTYPNGFVSTGELTVPRDRPVKLIMTSEDVIHSFFVPSFRVKHDIVPGQYSMVWFQAVENGNYPVECTEYCGTGHSAMLATVKVVDPDKYNTWLEKAGSADDALPPVALGEKLYTSQACSTCHSLDGSARVGPSWKGIWGRHEKFQDGSDGVVDENYVRQSILEPQAKIVAGYQPVMPTFKGVLNDKQIVAIIAYMKTLK